MLTVKALANCMPGLFYVGNLLQGEETMWAMELPVVGTDVYHIAFCFVIYSMGGWLVESIYMSFCNRKLTNRGFGFGPFCPIYGVGATIAYYMMLPFAASKVAIYLIGAVSATIFEYLVGIAMKRIFGEVWWDYNDKPFNYRGIICLESTLAWGVYAIVVEYFLHIRVLGLADRIGARVGIRFCQVVLILYLVDFIWHLLKALGINVREYRDHALERYRDFRARF